MVLAHWRCQMQWCNPNDAKANQDNTLPTSAKLCHWTQVENKKE